MKKALFLVGDYWHHANTIEPLVDVLFDKETWQVTFTEDPKELLKAQTRDLILSFKDPIENDQIPTPIWCDDEWTPHMMKLVKDNGTGLMLMHAATTDMTPEHPIVSHPITEGISEFTFPENDEHYVMSMIDGADILLAETKSPNGVQIFNVD